MQRHPLRYAVEVGALLGPGELGSIAVFSELDGGQGY